MIYSGGSGAAMIAVSGRPRAGERRAAPGRNRHKGVTEGRIFFAVVLLFYAVNS